MNKSFNYKPDCFVVIEVSEDNGNKFHKLLGGWSGSYIHGDSWRINSGIEKIVKSGKYYYVYGHSGSIYKVHEDSEGLKNSIYHVYNSLPKEKVKIVDISSLTIQVE